MGFCVCLANYFIFLISGWQGWLHLLSHMEAVTNYVLPITIRHLPPAPCLLCPLPAYVATSTLYFLGDKISQIFTDSPDIATLQYSTDQDTLRLLR